MQNITPWDTSAQARLRPPPLRARLHPTSPLRRPAQPLRPSELVELDHDVDSGPALGRNGGRFVVWAAMIRLMQSA